MNPWIFPLTSLALIFLGFVFLPLGIVGAVGFAVWAIWLGPGGKPLWADDEKETDE